MPTCTPKIPKTHLNKLINLTTNLPTHIPTIEMLLHVPTPQDVNKNSQERTSRDILVQRGHNRIDNTSGAPQVYGRFINPLLQTTSTSATIR